jgi:hypothetical protein
MRAVSVGIALIVLLLIIAVPYYLIALMANWQNTWCNYRIVQRELISDAYAGLKTGDIVLFISGGQWMTKAVARTYFSHVGTIVRDGDIVYISESQRGSTIVPGIDGLAAHRLKHGAVLSPFLTRVKYYMGVVYLLRLSRPLEASRAELLKSTAEQISRDEHPYPSARQASLSYLFGIQTHARHCFQQTAHLLDTVGLTSNLASAGFVKTCQLICNISDQILPDGYTYSHPIEIIYNIAPQQ